MVGTLCMLLPLSTYVYLDLVVEFRPIAVTCGHHKHSKLFVLFGFFPLAAATVHPTPISMLIQIDAFP